MIERKTIHVPVAVIGGGVLGLEVTHQLASKGTQVVLVEKSDKLASGASIRNHGILHKGTYHAAVIPDESEALKVTDRIRRGFSHVSQFAPESLRPNQTYALLYN